MKLKSQGHRVDSVEGDPVRVTNGFQYGRSTGSSVLLHKILKRIAGLLTGQSQNFFITSLETIFSGFMLS